MRTICRVCREDIKPISKAPPKAIKADPSTVAAALRRRIDPTYQQEQDIYKDGITASQNAVAELIAKKAAQKAAEKANGPVEVAPPAVVPAHGCLGGCSPFNLDFSEDNTQATCSKCGTTFTPSNPPVLPTPVASSAVPATHQMTPEQVQAALMSRVGEKPLPQEAATDNVVSELSATMARFAEDGDRSKSEPQTSVRRRRGR